MRIEIIPMTKALQLISGNDLNGLADALGQEFFSASSTPFESRLVVVPHPSMKEFLFRRFAGAPHLKIAAGIQVLPLHQAVVEILGSAALFPNKKHLPSFLELTLSIEEKLHTLANNESGEFSNLLIYLNAGDREKRQRRAAALSDELAQLFVRYGLFGKQFLPQWLKCEGWQQTLWRALFSEASPWTYPLQLLQRAQVKDFQGKIALFGFSYLSPAHLSFFATLSASLYHLSACALFWEDFVSDKERLLTHRFLQKEGANEAVREQIDGYMQKSHPLLGNFGKLGREMLKALDAFPLDATEIYTENLEGKNLLCQVKNAMLYLDEDVVLQGDDSLQLHSATSCMREVEICCEALQMLLHQRAQDPSPILPRDIFVCSPNIAAYAPYIHMIFSQSGCVYSVDAAPLRESNAVRGFLQLLALPQKRFSLESILKLLRSASLLEKWVFAPDEVHLLERWFKDANVLQDLSGHPNSWEEGIDRSLLGLAMTPASGIAHSEIDLLNRFLLFFSALKNDLALLVEERSASEWLSVFMHIAVKYFVIEWEREPFFQEMKLLALSCSCLREKVWNFASITRVLHHLADKATGTAHSSQMNRITFTSLTAGSVPSARILWCLGMDEATFPGADNKSSLCEMSRLKSGDYFPSKSDEDRSLFLEVLIKAQDYLIFSYQRMHKEDAKHQGPSPFIEELDQYLQQRGVLQGMEKIDHPGLPFDRSYFSQDAKSKKCREEDYLAAHAHYSSCLNTTPFFKRISSTHSNECTITIGQLKKLARNPLQFYFNETLKIYLKEEQDEEEAQFLISPLRRAVLRKRALHHSLPQVVRHLEGKGGMPRGLFSQVAEVEMQEEVDELLSVTKEFSLSPEEITSVHIKELRIQLNSSRVVHIVGKLEGVSPKGLLVHEKNDLSGLVKAWPLYLIYCCLYPENQALLLTKKGVKLEFALEDPKAALASYLEYYFLAECSPSPLMPDWAKAVFSGKEEELQKLLEKTPLFEDPYLSYIHRRKEAFNAKELLLQWSDVVKKTFGPLLHAL